MASNCCIWIPNFELIAKPLYEALNGPENNPLEYTKECTQVCLGVFLFLFFLIFFIVIQLQLYAFSPHPSTPPQVNPPPSPTSTLPLGFVHVSFIVLPVIPSTQVFKSLKVHLASAQALGLPNLLKPFQLYVCERQGVALGLLTQMLSDFCSPSHNCLINKIIQS